jgi:multidrug/hemolysin transport system ATP-binding protein
MEEAATSDNIVIIHKGEIKAQGTPLELKMEYAFDVLKMTLKNGQFVQYKLQNTVDALPIIDQHRSEISNVEIINGTMDDVFLNLTERLENYAN